MISTGVVRYSINKLVCAREEPVQQINTYGYTVSFPAFVANRSNSPCAIGKIRDFEGCSLFSRSRAALVLIAIRHRKVPLKLMVIKSNVPLLVGEWKLFAYSVPIDTAPESLPKGELIAGLPTVNLTDD